jgi:lipopolysaccharide export system permease protein
VWVFALPMGMLTATLLTFGRFSADQELTAARAGGVSLLSLVSPILGLAILLSAFSAWVTMDLGPRSRVAYKALIQQALTQVATTTLPARRHIKDFKGYIFYIEDNKDGELKGVTVFYLNDQNEVTITAHASQGRLTVKPQEQVLVVELLSAKSIMINGGQFTPGPAGNWRVELPLQRRRSSEERPDISDMTIRQLRSELTVLEQSIELPSGEAGLDAESVEAYRTAVKQRADLVSPVRFQINRQVAFSFACIGFTLVGIPLGIRVHRRETNIGVALALILVLVYYSFFILGQSFESRAEFAPHLIVWIPNFIFQVVGGVLLWRANRGI